MTVAVVGAGIHGLCTARSLCKRGHQVTLFEQHQPGNPFGSSVGRSRIVRQAYPDQFYSEILLQGHELWYDLEAEAGQKLIHEVGLLYLGPKDEPELWQELEALDNLRIPHRVYTTADVREVHPQMRLDQDEIAIITLSAGWADVPAVLGALQQIARARGVDLVQERVVGLGPEGLVRTGSGQAGHFDRVVVTAGAWVTKFFELPLKVTLQTFAYLDLSTQGPVWIEGFGDHLYGFPSEPGSSTTKIGFHTHGPETDPDSPDREPQERALQAIRECAARRFGQAEVVEAQACLYTAAPNDDFQIAWVDRHTLVASPCSGHGFKFGPWMGEFLADLAQGSRDLSEYPRFQMLWGSA